MLAFLRMKLRCPDISFMDDRGKLDLVIGCGQDELRWRLDVIRVDEIHEIRLGHPLYQTVWMFWVKLVPSHMRDAKSRRKLDDPALQKVESAVQTELFAFRK